MFEGLRIRAAKRRVELKELEQIEAYMGGDGLKRKEALEDSDKDDWVLLGKDSARKLDEVDSETLRGQAQKFYYKNPHARNVIRIVERYVGGRGFTIEPVSETPQVAEYWKTFWRTNKMDLRRKEVIRRTIRDGESFLRFFIVDGIPQIRFMNPAKVRNPDKTPQDPDGNLTHGIETDKNDVEVPVAYYYNNKRVDAEEVLHNKIGVDSDVKRGRSYLEVVIEWVARYEKWLRDRIKLNNLRTLIGLIRKVKSGTAKTAGVVSSTQTSVRKAPDGSYYQKAPDGVSIYTTNPGVDYEFKTPNLQAADVQHDGRAILLAVASGVGLAEYMVSADSSNSNYASTMVAEAPAVRELMDWQDYFKYVFTQIYEKVVKIGIQEQVIPEKETVQTREQVDDPLTGEITQKAETETRETSTECYIQFPEIIHRDLDKETKALTLQKDNRWVSDRTAQSRLDLDPAEENEQIEKEETEDNKRDREQHANEDYVQRRDKDTHDGPPDTGKEPVSE